MSANFINELPKEGQKEVTANLNMLLHTSLTSVCTYADREGINRKELCDLFLYLGSRYVKNHDVDKIKAINFNSVMERLRKLAKLKSGE